jgi:hypothetical protein
LEKDAGSFEKLGYNKRLIFLQIMNAVFTGTIAIIDNRRQIGGNACSKLWNNLIGKDYVFGLFHSPSVYFHLGTIEMRTEMLHNKAIKPVSTHQMIVDGIHIF